MSTADDVVADTGHEDAVRYEVTASGVAVLTLNRPERLNTWSGDMASAFHAGLDRAEEDPAVRVIVLTGRGRAFCAGAQLGSVGTVAESVETTEQRDLTDLVGERQLYYLTTLCKPVVAAVNGSCVGIGLTLALMCDVRFAAAGSKFAASFARRGLIAECGVSWILPRLTGWGVALDLLLSGRTFLADEAAELGLVKETVAPEHLMQRVMEYARTLHAIARRPRWPSSSGRHTVMPCARLRTPVCEPSPYCRNHCNVAISWKESPASSRNARRIFRG
jgi:enoyl-CoA hydratase/carnithine racemase